MNDTMMNENINEQNITNQINDALEKKRKIQREAFKKHYYENHEEVLKKKKEYNKIFAEKNKKRLHCELCDVYFIAKRKAEIHFQGYHHQKKIANLKNKFVIKNIKTGLYLM